MRPFLELIELETNIEKYSKPEFLSFFCHATFGASHASNLASKSNTKTERQFVAIILHNGKDATVFRKLVV